MEKKMRFGDLKVGQEFAPVSGHGDGEFSFVKRAGFTIDGMQVPAYGAVVGTRGNDDFSADEMVFVTKPAPVANAAAGGECRYCGLPAAGIGFFGEPVCFECGA